MAPGGVGDGLDRLDGDVALTTQGGECLEVGAVRLVLHHGVAVGQQHRVEIEALQRLPVRRGDRPAVAGDADVAYQALIAGGNGRFQRPARAERGLPLVRVDQVVELDQVNVVNVQPLQRAVDLLPRCGRLALAGFGRQEERPPVALDPVAQAHLGLAIAGGRIHVVDAVGQGHVHCGIGFGL